MEQPWRETLTNRFFQPSDVDSISMICFQVTTHDDKFAELGSNYRSNKVKTTTSALDLKIKYLRQMSNMSQCFLLIKTTARRQQIMLQKSHHQAGTKSSQGLHCSSSSCK